jgi:Icc-related predicted phosphoesterase
MPRIICVSDSHGQNLTTKWKWPAGDIPIHAGDATSKGKKEQLAKAGREMLSLGYRWNIFVPGNHDRLFYEDPAAALKYMPGIMVLLDETIEVMGLRIYGTSWLRFKHGKFPFEIENLKEVFGKIPTNTDILVTHQPPFHIMDKNWAGEHLGSDSLREIITERVKPKLHVFGHTHARYGIIEGQGKWRPNSTEPDVETIFVNACLVGEDRKPANDPIVVEIK